MRNTEEYNEDLSNLADQWLDTMKDAPKMADADDSTPDGGVPNNVEYGIDTSQSSSVEQFEHKNSEFAMNNSLADAIRAVKSAEAKKVGELVVYPRAEVICDRDHIDNQKVDVYSKEDGGLEIDFKIKKSPEEITEMIREALTWQYNKIMNPKKKKFHNPFKRKPRTRGGAVLENDQIEYTFGVNRDRAILCDAMSFERDGIKVLIADPTKRYGSGIYPVYSEDCIVHAAVGLVKVEVPATMSPEEAEKSLKGIMQKDFGIPDALDEVPLEYEEKYKKARYAWQNMLTNLTDKQSEKASQLVREEVFPGYSTFLDKGKHEEYLKEFGEDLRAAHKIYSSEPEVIYHILTQGLMSTTERISRGVMMNGMSSQDDLDSGGASSVFTRIQKKNQWMRRRNGVWIVMKPEIFDRTDWYSYKKDKRGSLDSKIFENRLSPNELFSVVNKTIEDDNEQMFRTGIGPDYIESIYLDPTSRDKLIGSLKNMGLNEVNGKPIEEIILASVDLNS